MSFRSTTKLIFSKLPHSIVTVVLLVFVGCGGGTEDTGSVAGTNNIETAVAEVEEEPIDDMEYDDQFEQAREFMQRGEHQQAYDMLWGISDTAKSEYSQLRAEIELCKTLSILGQNEEAVHKRNSCLSRLRELTDKTEQPDFRYFVLMADAYASEPDLEAGVKILNNARSRYDEQDVKRQLSKNASRIYLEAAQQVEAIDSEESFKFKLNNLSLALSYDETNKQAQFLTLSNYIVTALNEDQQNWLADLAIDSDYPAGVRVIVGIRSAIRNDKTTADRNFRVASQANNDVGKMVDGLLDYTVKSRSIPDDRMMDLIETAISIFPDTPQLKRVRGTQNMFQANYGQASEDFQSYLNSSQNELCIWSRRMLAEAHRKLGNSEQAASAELSIETAMQELSLEDKEIAQQILSQVNSTVRKQFN